VEHEAAVVEAMDAVRRARLRTGAVRRALFRDRENPGRFVEAYLVPSWDEHLRLHFRPADRLRSCGGKASSGARRRPTAGEPPDEVVQLAEAVDAEVLVVGGDVRAVQMFRGRLPKRWQERLVQTDADSRHSGADDSALDDVTVQAITAVADRHVREAIDRYRAQLGDGTASTGLADVVTRLQRGQVDTVLLVDYPSSTDMLWIDPGDATLVSVDDHVLRDAGVREPQKVRADAGLLRAVARTGADLVLVGAGEVELEHGIGGVLRYADASSAASA
jgi:hypothetical protein